jgi:transketolase
MRPPIRLAALMRQQVIYVFTHDSVFLGEDGPTHQPIEQLASLRVIPNLRVVRPADGQETAMAWAVALERRDGPTALILSRQSVPPLARPAGFSPETMKRGGYLLSRMDGSGAKDSRAGSEHGDAPLVLIATGSEVAPALDAQGLLAKQGISSSVVSMPCPELFLDQAREYRESVIPDGARCVAIEAARPQGWERIVGRKGLLIGVERFGASAPQKVLAEKFGFTGPQIADRVLRWHGAR